MPAGALAAYRIRGDEPAKMRPLAGRVYAVDINSDFLKLVAKKAKKANLKNVKTVQAKAKESGLPEKSVDLIFMRNVFHHIKNPAAYFKALKPALRPGARLAIIDYRPKLISMGHNTSAQKIKQSLKKAGYRVQAEYDFLPSQSFTVFVVK